MHCDDLCLTKLQRGAVYFVAQSRVRMACRKMRSTVLLVVTSFFAAVFDVVAIFCAVLCGAVRCSAVLITDFQSAQGTSLHPRAFFMMSSGFSVDQSASVCSFLIAKLLANSNSLKTSPRRSNFDRSVQLRSKSLVNSLREPVHCLL